MSFDRLLAVLGFAGSIFVLATAFRLEPDPRGVGTHEKLGLPPCQFLVDHDAPCISCGMTTAFCAMAHRRVDLAFRANPFGALLFVLMLAAPIHCVHSFARNLDPLRFFRHPRAATILPVAGVLLLVNWGVLVLVHRART